MFQALSGNISISVWMGDHQQVGELEFIYVF